MVVILTADHTHRAVMLPRWSSIPCCRAVSTWLVSLPPHLLKPQTPARRPLMPWREVTDARGLGAVKLLRGRGTARQHGAFGCRLLARTPPARGANGFRIAGRATA